MGPWRSAAASSGGGYIAGIRSLNPARVEACKDRLPACAEVPEMPLPQAEEVTTQEGEASTLRELRHADHAGGPNLGAGVGLARGSG
jgi:hypothetical protein